jgi:prepilin-type N-terminal cleavage/methylation domain-containing protein
MKPPTRRCEQDGFTLVELLLAMVLFAITSSLILGSLRLMERVQHRTSEKAASQVTLRTGIQTVATELRELNNIAAAGVSDLKAMSANSVTYWGMRASGMTCEITTSAVKIRLGSTFSAARAPVNVRDSLLIFSDRDSLLTSDDQWVQVPVLGTPSASTCPDGAAALSITTPSLFVADYHVPGPVRIFELMQLAIVTTGGRRYLGARSLSGGGPLQPVVGPVTAGGLEFVYRDQDGAETATPSAVRAIDLTLRSQTARRVNRLGGGGAALLTDSLALRVLVRNSR